MTWPGWIVKAVSPEHSSLQQRAAELLAPFGLAGSVSLSLAPVETRTAALIWAAVAALFFAAAAVAGGSRYHRRALGAVLGGVALFQVVYGAIHLGTGLIWGMDEPRYASRLRGTFINPDHLAVYLEICLAAVFAWGWCSVRRARQEVLIERRVLWVVPPVLVWLILFTGLAFSGSRAGLVAATAAVLLQGLLIAWTLRRWRVAMVGAGAAMAGFAAVTVLGLQQGLGRWMATSSQELTWNHRFMVYEAAWELWLRFPWTGTGLGTFQEAFTLVQPGELPMLWTNAHNDLLELLVTTGVVGAALFLTGAVVLLAQLARVLKRGHRSEDRAAALAALGALAALAFHSLLDFGLTVPANSATLAIVCGAAAGTRVR